MDLVCTSCGEPWDLDYVLHEEPEAFEMKGSAIVSCPCCPEQKGKVTKEQKKRLEVARELGELLGDDVDGYAAELEDMQGYLESPPVSVEAIAFLRGRGDEDDEDEEEHDREVVAYNDGTVLPAMKFSLGQLKATPGVLKALTQEEILVALQRHANGDWGQLDEEDRQANERALRDKSRLLSVYHSVAGVRFYVITEHDRSITTVLLPEEY